MYFKVRRATSDIVHGEMRGVFRALEMMVRCTHYVGNKRTLMSVDRTRTSLSAGASPRNRFDDSDPFLVDERVDVTTSEL